MGEYEDWARREAAERDARIRLAAAERQAAREEERRTERSQHDAAMDEARRILQKPSDRLAAILEDALTTQFRNSNQSQIRQYLSDWNWKHPDSITNYVTAKWGEQLELSPEGQAIILGRARFAFWKSRPEHVLDHRYQQLSLGVKSGSVQLSVNYPGYSDMISMDEFMSNNRAVFPLIQRGLEANDQFHDYYRLTKHGSYELASRLREQARIDAQDA